MSEKTFVNILRGLVVAVVIGAWHLTVSTGFISDRIVAAPLDVARAIPSVLRYEGFWSSTYLTLWQAGLAFVFATIIGTVLGVLAASYEPVRRAIVPYLILGNSFPAILLYPVLVVILGLGTKSIVTVSMGIPIMVVAVNTMEGLLGVPAVYQAVGQSLNATPSQMFFKVRLPAARAIIVVGWRVALLYAFLGVIAVQFLLTGQGLGFLIIRYYDFFQVEELYASIVIVGLITLAIELLLLMFEHWIVGGERRVRRTARPVGIG